MTGQAVGENQGRPSPIRLNSTVGQCDEGWEAPDRTGLSRAPAWRLTSMALSCSVESEPLTLSGRPSATPFCSHNRYKRAQNESVESQASLSRCVICSTRACLALPCTWPGGRRARGGRRWQRRRGSPQKGQQGLASLEEGEAAWT